MQNRLNNSDLLELTALIDRAQGRWEKSIAGLEKARSLDPRNPEILYYLAVTTSCFRRFQDAQRILDRAIQLEPDQPWLFVTRIYWDFSEKADVEAARVASEALPSSIKDDPFVLESQAFYAMSARDFDAAEEILKKSPTKELWMGRISVPKEFFMLWLEFLQGNHPAINQFGDVREQVNRRVQADPTNPFLMLALARADLALGRKEEAIEEGRRAMELRPISEDAFDGTEVAFRVAQIFALGNQPEAAFAQLNILLKGPASYFSYGELKTDPGWDPLRKDLRFDKLLAELAPRD